MKINKKALYKAIGSVFGIVVLLFAFIYADNNYGRTGDRIVLLALLYILIWFIVYIHCNSNRYGFNIENILMNEKELDECQKRTSYLQNNAKKIATYITSSIILLSILAYFYPIAIIVYFIIIFGVIVYCTENGK
jgi:amino acid transporter